MRMDHERLAKLNAISWAAPHWRAAD